MQGEIPTWMIASKAKTDLKTDRIPTNSENEYLEITYYDIPFGVNVWSDVESEIAQLERQIEKNKKNKTASLTANAVQVEQIYHKALLKKMIVALNGVKVDPAFFDVGMSQAGGLMLQKWIKFKIEGEPFPKPKWLVIQEDSESDPQNPILPSSPGPDTPACSGRKGDEGSIGF